MEESAPNAGLQVIYGNRAEWLCQVLYAAREYLTEGFAVINSDDFYGRDAFFKAAEHLRNHADGDHYCMVGYSLGNTLSDSGTVSRGQCFVNENGMLDGVTERTDI